MSERRPQPIATEPLLETLIELARIAARNAEARRARRKLTIVEDRSKRGGEAA